MTTDDNLDRRLNPFRYDDAGNLTDAARRQDRSLRPDASDGARGPVDTSPVLTVSARVLNRCADDTDTVARDFARVCRAPLSSTREVAKGLRGFRCAGAFAALEARWQAETRYVETRLLGTFAENLRDGATAYTDQNRSAAESFGN